ncbi:MAG: gliding motility-associated C-terminal domain-containing protein, partial [Lutibacter sp.]|nr:gliding motility-associated C-terminal domain-containing protein [Lutibacter sp.]
FIAQTAATYTIKAGSTTVTIPVSVLGDLIAEPIESFTGTITIDNANSQQVTIGTGVGTATATITDNDAASIAIADVSATEGAGTATYTVTLTGNVQDAFSVSYATSDNASALAGVDYTATSGTLTFPANSASGTIKTFTVAITDDNFVEPTEDYKVTLSGITGLTTILDADAIGSITDNDAASIAIADVSVAEGAGTATYTVTLTGNVQDSFTVNYATSANTAIGDVDYTTTTGTLNFPANSASGTTKTFTVAITDDNFVEPTEDYKVTLSGITGLTTILDADAIGSITDNDAASIAIADVSVAEGAGTATYTVTLTGNVQDSFTVNYATSANTAIGDVDYTTTTGTLNFPANSASGTTKTFTVAITDDSFVEPTEDYKVTLSGITGLTTISDAVAIGSITDNDAASISIADVSVNEGAGTAMYTVTLTGNVQDSFTVNYATSANTAIGDVDYTTTSGMLTFPANSASGTTKTFTVAITDDNILEPVETFKVTLSNISGGLVTISNAIAIGSITNDDAASVTIADISGLENGGPITVTATLDYAVQGGFKVTINTIDGTATTENRDYTAVTNQILTFIGIAGETQTFMVIPTADTILEFDETVTVSMSNLTNTTLPVNITDIATVTITNDDASVTLDINNVSASEGDNNTTVFEFVVRMSSSSSLATTVDYKTVDGTATIANNDYVGISTTTLTFLPGEISKTIVVIVNTDNVAESDEVFTVELSNLITNGNAISLGSQIGVGTIINDDYLPVLTDVFVEGIEDNSLKFTAGNFTTSYSDLDGDALHSIVIVSLPENGILHLNNLEVIAGDTILVSEIKNLVFLPNSNWYGDTSFEFNASDGVNSALLNAQVMITIKPVNDLPIAIDDFITTEQNVPIVNGSTAENDTYSEDGGNVWSLVGENGGAKNGSVTMNEEGVYTYTPTIYFFGTDSFVYRITDIDGDFSNAVVTISVVVDSDSSIELIKTAVLEGNGNVNDRINYTFTIKNTGNVNLNDISISDPLISNTPIAAVGMLEPNAIAVVKAFYTINQADVDAGSVTNTAIVTGVDVLGNEISDISDNGNSTEGNDNPTIISLEQKPEIAIIKTAVFNDDNSDGFAQVGETITYSFKVSNIGNVALFDVIVEDPLPGIVVSGYPISLEAGMFDDASFTATYKITQEDINLGSVVNQAFVTAISSKGIVVGDSSDDLDNFGNNPTVLEISGCVIEVFNAVSPNGDGNNDVFYIRGLECYSDNRVEIYNRWGSLVFERDHYNNTDRSFRGISEGRFTVKESEELPDGVYFYILKYKDVKGDAHQKAGYLYINRR